MCKFLDIQKHIAFHLATLECLSPPPPPPPPPIPVASTWTGVRKRGDLCENVQLANNVLQGLGQLWRHGHLFEGLSVVVAGMVMLVRMLGERRKRGGRGRGVIGR